MIMPAPPLPLQRDDPLYPQMLREEEAAALATRRQLADVEEKSPILGLALSGGGVRSATFNLGILQVLARQQFLRTVDYLSTVSGGGYIGAFLGRFFTRYLDQAVNAAELVEQDLTAGTSPSVSWLRKNSNYISPAGRSNVLDNAALYVRNFLSLHFVLGVFLFSIFCLANLFRYVLPCILTLCLWPFWPWW